MERHRVAQWVSAFNPTVLLDQKPGEKLSGRMGLYFLLIFLVLYNCS